MAAQFATPEAINFMATHGRGLICLSLTAERCDELGLDLMAAKNESPFNTAFTVSIEAAEGVTTGISAHDRAHTIQVAMDPHTDPDDLVQPGHVFPLKAKDGGVLERAGQTEAAVDLARLAGLIPAGVICEIMNEDGTMARVPDLVPYCERHGLKMITVADLIAYRRRKERLVERVVSTRLPTAFGEFTAVGYRSLVDDKHHLAMVKGDVRGREDVLVRVHSECLTGDVFHSLRCDCGEQLEAALSMIEREGVGRPALPLAGGPRDRAAQQAPRLPAAGGRARHRRREPEARAAGRPSRLRDRRADPGRPRALEHPHPDQQPEEDPRPRGLRALGQRPAADPGRPQPPQRGVPAHQARPPRPHAPPPGSAARRGADPRGASGTGRARGAGRRRGRAGGWLTPPRGWRTRGSRASPSGSGSCCGRASSRSAWRPSTPTWRSGSPTGRSRGSPRAAWRRPRFTPTRCPARSSCHWRPTGARSPAGLPGSPAWAR